MELSLKAVVPTYFEKEQVAGSGIWGQPVTFSKGEHLHVVAPSGSGKTSLIHFLYGLRKDYTGDVLYEGRPVKSMSPEELALYRQQHISIVFQDLRLFTGETARSNIELKRQLAPFHPAAKIDEMAARLGIAKKLDKLAKTCSYGEQQRVAILRSLMQPFDFLLLDEPFSNLDEANRVKAFELISEECAARGASMIFADLKALDFLQGQKIVRL